MWMYACAYIYICVYIYIYIYSPIAPCPEPWFRRFPAILLTHSKCMHRKVPKSQAFVWIWYPTEIAIDRFSSFRYSFQLEVITVVGLSIRLCYTWSSKCRVKQGKDHEHCARCYCYQARGGRQRRYRKDTNGRAAFSEKWKVNSDTRQVASVPIWMFATQE